jgi:hypothetical protein
MISHATIEEVRERSKGYCENSECRKALIGKYDNHHINWRSAYRKSDRDEAWNIAALCVECHYSIHSQGNTRLDKVLKGIASVRREDKEVGKIHKDILAARVRGRRERKKAVDRFKENHQGLSPSQVAYRKQKQYLKNKQSLDTHSE